MQRKHTFFDNISSWSSRVDGVGSVSKLAASARFVSRTRSGCAGRPIGIGDIEMGSVSRRTGSSERSSA